MTDWETTNAYNEDVECVMETIHEYLDHHLSGDQEEIDQDVEDAAAHIVDQLFSRWFDKDYSIQLRRELGEA